MSKMNMKLMMQGIDEAEGLLNKKQQTQNIQAEIPTKGMEENVAVEESPSDSSIKVSASEKPTRGKKEVKNKKTKTGTGQKQVFSFRASLEDIAVWKAYAVATDIPMERIGTLAMTEYVNRHKLQGPELAVFHALMAREKK